MRTPILALCALAAFCGVSQPASAATFSVYPSPGTLTAGARTQISFRGGAPSAIEHVTITGSRSGTHRGTLRAHSDGKGASFVPGRPFTAGERVRVRTGLDIAGARNGDYGFTIGEATTRKTRPVELPGIGHGAVQSYASRPDLDPPAVAVDTAKPGLAPGLVFLAPKAGRGQDGPMIIDNAGRLVWFHPILGGNLGADFRVQTYQGKPVLTWWQGRLFVGDGTGVGMVYDQRYRQVARVRAGNGFPFDLHEFTITPRNTALITAYARFKRDLRPWGGPRHGRVVDGMVQEIDIKTGLVEFEWHSFGNVGLSESYTPHPDADGFEWDYIHVNSAAEDNDGNFLISGRNTWGVYKVSRRTGHILWRLGGRKSDFKMGPGTHTAWQHSARRQADGTITLYDNGAAPPVRKHSRAITIRLNERAKTATLVSALTHPRGLLSASQGDVERLPNGNTFVGFGSQRWFTEYGPDGQVLFDGHLARGNDTYRAFRFPWTGTPAEAPRVAATTKNGQVKASASWNGATGVARWQLLAGPSAGALAPVADAPATDFETSITVPTTQPFVAMRALEAGGAALATSAPVRPKS